MTEGDFALCVQLHGGQWQSVGQSQCHTARQATAQAAHGAAPPWAMLGFAPLVLGACNTPTQPLAWGAGVWCGETVMGGYRHSRL